MWPTRRPDWTRRVSKARFCADIKECCMTTKTTDLPPPDVATYEADELTTLTAFTNVIPSITN